MYIPKAFKQQELAAALEIITNEPFGMLISALAEEISVTHLPFNIVQSEPDLVLCSHMAKANAHWRHLEGARAVAVFRGVHGYISPRWYSHPKRDVPTWNYAVVHCTGTVHIAPEEDKAPILRRLVRAMEDGAPDQWSLDAIDPDYFDEQKNGIVAFYLSVKKIEAKFKLSQNRTVGDRDGAIAGLRESSRQQDHLLAREMQRFAPGAQAYL